MHRLEASRRVAALDGLRGFALVGMLAWHAELDWVRGGFARMTIFFVLSGYLATRSWNRRRDEGFRSFWVRRTLRLLPMTLVGVAVAIVVTLAVGSQGTKAALGGDVVSVLTYTSNWHFLDTGQSYGELFERQSAFQHYWSLSIEEQLFLALPVLLAAGAVLSRWLRRPQWIVLSAVAVLTGLAALLATPSADGVYFGTQTRLIEFLVGAALAVSVSAWSAIGPRATRVVGWIGRSSAAAIVLTLALVDRGAPWLYEGGIYLFALPVIAVVAAIELGDQWLSRILEVRPLVLLGRAALSIYVLHWPLFVLVEDIAPSGTAEPLLATVKVVAGVLVGAAAYRYIESPMLDDTRRLLRGGLPVVRRRLAPLTAGAAVLVVVGVGVPAAEPAYEFEEAAAAFEAGRPVIDTDTTGHEVAVFGGSTALMNGLGLANWAHRTDQIEVRTGDARLGCGLLQHGERPQSLDRNGDRRWFPVEDTCRGWPNDWRIAMDRADADVALVFLGVWEITDWRFDDGAITSIEDPPFRAALESALHEGIQQLAEGGARHVVLMTSPVVGGGVLDEVAADRGLPSDHPARTDLFNDLLRERADAQPGLVSIFDYAAAIGALGDDLPRLVPDGVHPTWDAADELWSGELGRALLDHLAAVTRG